MGAVRDGDRCRSDDAVIRVYDEAGNVIESHEHKGDFNEPYFFIRPTSRLPIMCDRLSLALRLKNRGCLVGEDSRANRERGRSDDNDARALF